MSLGKQILTRRERQGISQTQFAAEVGISQAMQSCIEKNISKPSPEILKETARLLNCTVDDLLADD